MKSILRSLVYCVALITLAPSGWAESLPQWAYGALGNPKFQGIYYPPQAHGRGGMASLKLGVNETGKVTAASVIYEHPPGVGFGKETVGPIRDATFIPGFRNGKPVSCTFTWTFIFTGPGRQMKTG